MDVISMGFIFFAGTAAILAVSTINNKILYSFSKWKQLGLQNYRILKNIKQDYGEKLIVEVPLGGSLDEFAKYKGKIEKAFSCECEIIDINYSRNIEVLLKNKKNG